VLPLLSIYHLLLFVYGVVHDRPLVSVVVGYLGCGLDQLHLDFVQAIVHNVRRALASDH
jgi:hypothetical protein